MNIFLQPAGKIADKQLQITILKKENLDNLQKYINKEQYNELKEIFFFKELNMWGVNINKKNIWQKIKIGDMMLFYGNKKFFVKGIVKYKMHNHPLSLNTWGTDKDSLCWEYIYFLDNAESINISLEEFKEITGYRFQHVQGFMKVDQEKAEKIFERYDEVFKLNYLKKKQDEKQSKIEELRKKIDNIDIENANTNFKIINLKENETNKKNRKKSDRNYNKNAKEKNKVMEYLPDEYKYHFGVQGELYIYKLLKEKNKFLLKELKLWNKDIEVICYNKDYNRKKDWEDKSINKGHDILIKTVKGNEEIYLEIKTSLDDTKLFTMTGNELKFSKEKRDKYYVIKITNFADVNEEEKSKLKIYFIQNPYQSVEECENIKEISMYA